MENFINKLRDPKTAVCVFMLVWTAIMSLVSLFTVVPQGLAFLHALAVLASIFYLFPFVNKNEN